MIKIERKLFQRWISGGLEQWRLLPQGSRNVAMWHELHEPGSIMIDHLIWLRDHGDGLPDPPPFPKKPRGRRAARVPLHAALSIQLTIDQVAVIRREAAAAGASFGGTVRKIVAIGLQHESQYSDDSNDTLITES